MATFAVLPKASTAITGRNRSWSAALPTRQAGAGTSDPSRDVEGPNRTIQ